MECYAINEKTITGKTVICGIIGDPIEHTISPVMQNAAFQQMNLDYIYLPFKVERSRLGQAIQGMRALNMRGLNVTIPHKRAVISSLEEIDSLAENIGSVNTLVNTRGLIKGYNTDALGFLKALQAEGIKPEKKRIVVLGAGGAARAIIFILVDKGSEITIINRHADAARELADWTMNLFRQEIRALELNRDNLKTSLGEADILVNTTSVGMSPNTEETLIPAGLLKPGLVVFDIIYNPFQTKLLKEAERRGARVISGLEMLVWQGAAAFELWTGQKAPVATMREAARKALQSGS